MVEREWEGQLLKYYDGGEGVRLSWAKILANFGHTDSRVPMIRRHEVTGVLACLSQSGFRNQLEVQRIGFFQ